MEQLSMDAMEEQKALAQQEKEELQRLIEKEKEKKAKLTKAKKSVTKKAESGKKMVPWVEGIFINRENEGGILSFIFQGNRFAIKDGETAEVPEYIADHLNGLQYTEVEWSRNGSDDHEGKQGVKRVKGVRKRCEFRIMRRFEREADYKIPRPERHRL